MLLDAVSAGAFPAASVDVGSSAGPLWQDAVATSFDTLFDLASLTKPVVTGSVIMRLVGDKRIALDDLISSRFKEWRGGDRAQAEQCGEDQRRLHPVSVVPEAARTQGKKRDARGRLPVYRGVPPFSPP